ncbi:unnamed protein product (macronuclear) [Paramecium tetraurelia]|uniref:Chromosome undetermined scaffold_134, whole genome shotgun sequence n=1 Tax=Paramecium tetraurelia TaxID=5888 RepID=Q3SE28_PARTE|nr:uncharacterized protein GSPATT00033115001 [Paramecium tetraurelia]CAI39097.1 Dicer-like ribonuclease with mutated helicase and Rnase III domains [Paramecium tetraurelia]CAK63262.1 unnamed protein product [Paramecium tetraurelia]|eukprot:XP_001430660.1 hypothetical protein (macronuclear) [Paramecium tetraurelia strain d4-2]
MYELPADDKKLENMDLQHNSFDVKLIEDDDEEDKSQISQFLQNVIKQPEENLFDLDISESQEQQNEPKDSLSSLVDQMLSSISNNQEILNNKVNLLEEDDTIVDTIEEFEFRDYQIELYEKGIGKNSIIYLETGLGKTLVIIMLMWDRLFKYPDKKIVFLANTVQLVEQQAQQIKQKLPRVAELISDDDSMIVKAKEIGSKLNVLHGSKCTDIWNQIMWQIILEESKILVMTTQIFLNILRKGLVKISNFSFIAMDECHNAIQDHPYNYILKEFYLKTKFQSDNQFLPQIVGATASPVMNSKSVSNNQLLQELLQLSANMDSQYLHIDAQNLKKHIKEAQIVPIYYKMLFNDPDIQKVIDLKASLTNCEKNENKALDVMRRNSYLTEFFQIKQTLENFKKKYSYDLQTKILIAQIEKQVLINGFQMYLELGQYLFVLLVEYVIIKLNDFLTIKRPPNQAACLDILKSISTILKDAKLRYSNVQQSSTPKVQVLFELIRKAYSQGDDNSRILIFVKQRLTAFFLNRLIEEYLASERINIVSNFIIGHCSSMVRKQNNSIMINVIESNKEDQEELIKKLYAELQNDQSKFSIEQLKDQVNRLNIFAYRISSTVQNDIINKFRQGKIKILISTSVAEEGIDIPMCNYVIGFNPISSSKAYVQMKGRARKENSQFMIFMVDKLQQAQVQSHQQVQNNIKQIIEELTAPQRQQMLNKAMQTLQSKTYENTYFDSFEIEGSGALINTNWSCQLIQQLCQKFNQKDADKTQPKYAIYQLHGNAQTNQQFIAFLLLPISMKSFIFYGKLAPSSKDAKASAAFEASVQLYQKGYIDDNLQICFDSDLGQHIGADQDDSQIMMTREQWQIACKYSQRLVQSQSTMGGKVNSQKRYYTNLFKTLFQTKDQEGQFEDFLLYECLFQNEKILLAFPKQMLPQISKSENTLQALGIQFQSMQKISKSQYEGHYKKYVETIIKEENLQQWRDDIYAIINQKCQIRIKSESNSNLLLILKGSVKSKFTLSQIINQFALRFKVDLFQDKIKEQLIQKIQIIPQNIKPHINEVLNSTSKYIKYLTSLQYCYQNELDSLQLNFIHYSVSDVVLNFDVKDRLDEILFKSLDLSSHKYNELLLGHQYYKFLIAVVLYANYFENDINITRAKYKTFTRSTYVRNCLLESYLFLYLHKNDLNDITTQFIGLEKFQDNFDMMMEQLILDDFSVAKRKSQRNTIKNKIHISNQEFFQFIQNSLFLIQQNDQDLVNGLNWLRTFRIMTSMKIHVNSSQCLQEFLPGFVPLSEQTRKIKRVFSSLEYKIKYQFKHFELLFQAMTDISFKFVINNKLKFKYYEQFQKKEEFQGMIQEQQWIEFKSQFECMNETDQNNYENSLLAMLGKALWNYLTIKILNENNLDCFAIKIVGKILSKTPFLAYLAIQLGLQQYLNSIYSTILLNLASEVEKCKDSSLAFKIGKIQKSIHTQCLETAFFALVGAIYLDSNCSSNIVMQWATLILDNVQVQQFYSPDFIKRQPKYQFYQWYQSNIGNPFNFNLIKIPHQDYRRVSQGDKLFIPYDMLEAQIVNIKKDKYYEISQLHIYAKSKEKAWEKLYEMIDY